MLKLNEDWDLEIIDGELQVDTTVHTTLVTALFTDKGRYWLPLISSELWKFNDSPMTPQSIQERLVCIEDTLTQLVQEGHLSEATGDIIQQEDGKYVIEVKARLDKDSPLETRTYPLYYKDEQV